MKARQLGIVFLMIKIFFLAFSQIFDPNFRKIMWLGVAGAFAIFFLIWIFVGYFIWKLDFIPDNSIFSLFKELADNVFRFFGGTFVLVLTWFIFPSVVSLILAFFLEKAALIVETKYYPKILTHRSQSLYEIIWVTLKYSSLSILINLLVLPLYIGLFFLGPINLIIFFIVNGYLLGREYFELVFHRYHSPKISRKLFKKFRKTIFVAGCIIAFLMTLPFINLIAPLIATAAMVHISHKLLPENEEIMV